jgi:hypothetical protein
MPILNYTTKIDPAKTAGEVQTLLANSGAVGVATQFERGEPVGLAFTAMTQFGLREFALPINWQAVQRVLRKQRVQASFQTDEHARRVAWRITKDWVEAQLAIIQTETVGLDQVMLPYMRTGDNGETVFEQYQDGQRLLLESNGEAR